MAAVDGANTVHVNWVLLALRRPSSDVVELMLDAGWG